MLPFSFYLRIFPFSLYPAMGFQISLCKFHKNSLSEKLLKGKAVTLRWIKRTENSFSESFIPGNLVRFFLFQHSSLWAYKYHFPDTTREPLRKASWRESCNSVTWINRTECSLSESFFSLFNRRCHLFHRCPLWDCKYHFSYSKRTVLA